MTKEFDGRSMFAAVKPRAWMLILADSEVRPVNEEEAKRVKSAGIAGSLEGFLGVDGRTHGMRFSSSESAHAAYNKLENGSKNNRPPRIPS